MMVQDVEPAATVQRSDLETGDGGPAAADAAAACECPPADCPPIQKCLCPPAQDCTCDDQESPKDCPPAEFKCEEQGAEPAKTAKAADSAGGAGGPAGAPPHAGWRSSPHVAATSYKPGLRARQMQKGVVSYGAPARPRRALAKLLNGEPISVAAVGGSITWGEGAENVGQTDYAARVFAWIRETFPKANHTLVNAAIPGVPSSYFALCNRWHVPEDVDLVVFNVNDNVDGSPGSGMRLAHERLLRKLLQYRNRPAVLELVFYRYPAPDFTLGGDLGSQYRYHGDDEIGVLAQYYHTPWLATRSLVWDYLQETALDPKSRTGEMVGMWATTDDGDHPSDTGHGWLADLVIYWMQQVMDDLVRHPLEAEDEEEAQAPLSLPMYIGNFESKSNTCLMGTMMKDLVTAADPAFKWVNEGTAKKPKWGYVSTQPGSSLEITLSTNVLEGQEAGYNVSLGVGHLKSYEHMGWWEMTCVEGCACDPLTRNGHHVTPEKQSQLFHAMALVSASDTCRLRFTVLDETESGEHKFKLLGLVISEAADMVVNTEPEEDHPVSIQYELGKNGTAAEFALGGI
ncbi:expressed protein [Chlorella variabilis]|uniref:Expressed protein n=1 Tax=Chlorella variabilis TaxID=554065 RepID=E1ZL46_CHLVA|nr:expressed protein [Chlorella variabilis]EFN53595.1 expressed protein [Chlorella variabilis]|eukprot:XP_005845697.1 expressed protein [Chlorella variabilis]